jgi:hypothetical protein
VMNDLTLIRLQLVLAMLQEDAELAKLVRLVCKYYFEGG